MKKLTILLGLFFGVVTISPLAAQVYLSYEESLNLLDCGNKSLIIADKEIEIAEIEYKKIRSFWFPQIQSTGVFTQMSSPIEVIEPLSQFTIPTQEYIQSIFPDDELVAAILDDIGQYSFVVPLMPQNIASIDLLAEWVVFSGGERMIASRIAKSMIDLAQTNKKKIIADQQNQLVQTYYGLRLMQQIIEVREEAYRDLTLHYQNALKLEAVGMIDKAARLYAQVNMLEAQRAFEAAQKNEIVTQNALKTLLNQKDSLENIIPTSPLFIVDSVPAKTYFIQNVNKANYFLHQLKLQQNIARHEIQLSCSEYFPEIELFGKQTLYSYGIESNLVPRGIVGVGFTWNIFDGLSREKKIKQFKLTEHMLQLEQNKAQDEFGVAVNKLYSQLQNVLDNVSTLNLAIELSDELCRIRKKAFIEGMATTVELIDAENILANVKVDLLTQYYEFDMILMNLLTLCGIPEQFSDYQTKSY
jgi:Outer membrane protein